MNDKQDGVHTITFPNGSSIDLKEFKDEDEAHNKVLVYENNAPTFSYPPVRERQIPEWKKRRSDGIKRNRHHRHGKRNR